MKVLIISLPRSGSTSLMKKISEEKNLKPIDEPFHVRHTIARKNFGDNIVLKTIVNQFPKIAINPVEWYIDFSKNFDETILLARKDLKACSESLAFYNHHKNNGFKKNDEYFWEKTPNYDTAQQYVYGCFYKLIKISEMLNIPLIFYEDIYDLNSKDRLRKGDIVKPTNLI